MAGDQCPKLLFLAGVSTGVAATLLYVTLQKQKALLAAKKRVSKEILPDLVQVHSTIRDVAERFRLLSDLRSLPFLPSDGGRQWMFNLMPIWNWETVDGAPRAAEFWKLAHAVSRDQNCDDWVAPHVTLHSRSKDLNGLAEKFCQLISDLGKESWKDVLFTLRDGEKWAFADDDFVKKPSAPNIHVLHKVAIEFPEPLRTWFEDNQDRRTLMPRKQDNNKSFDRIPIRAPLHISLYSFRVARLRKDSGIKEDEEQPIRRTTSYNDPRAAHHRLPSEDDVLADLMRADWMLVLLSPGRTDTPAVEPQVLAAVSLSDLASDALRSKRKKS